MQYSRDASEDLNAYMEHLTSLATGVHNSRLTTDFKLKHILPYTSSINTTWVGRCFYVTEDGRPGLASQASQPGDQVCVFFGTKTPFILRPVENKDTFLLISDAYLDGVMWGEALEGRNETLDRYFLLD